MSNFLNKIVYLTQDQYDSLIAGTLVGHTYDPNTIYITDSSDAATVNGHTVAIDVPANALFTDTNKYHTSGSWSNLTYTATAVNGAEALTFTIPTGSTATTVAVGNHDHNGTYIKTITPTTDKAIVRFNGTSGEVQNSIVTIEDNGDISINTVAGGAPSLTLQRGTASDAYTDWKIVDTSGKLSFQSRSGSATWTERASFADNSGNFTITGTMTASSFSGSGASLTNLPSDKLTGTISMDRIAAGAIAPAKLDSTSTITIGTQAIKVGSSFTISTLVTDLGLSKALRFIGTVASNSSYTPSDGTSGKPTITGLSSYTPVVGDVVLDSNNDEEYVCISVSGTTYTWELLGRSGSWAPSDHTHNISLTATGTATINLSSNTAYTLTAGGSSIIFKTPADTTYSVVSKTANGLCPQLPNETITTKFLRQDGNWSTLPNASSSTAGIVTLGTSGGAAEYSHTHDYLPLSGGIITGGGLEIKGHIAGDSSTTTGHGLYSGGMYHNAYNNIILHGDNSTGSSGIAFISDKVATNGTITNVNAPSDRAFIQYHACGITTATADGTAPTIATSGEAGRLVIGIGNDSGDKIVLQAPGSTDIVHQRGATSYPIPYTSNTNGTVGGTTTPVYVDAGEIKALSYTIAKSVPADAVFTDTTSFTITANATDGLWNLTGSSDGTNAVTYSLDAYNDKQDSASFYTEATDPDLTTRLNYDGYFYATILYSGGNEVLTSHNNLVKQTAKTDDVNYKLLASAQASPTSETAYEAIYNTKIYINPSLNSINAGRFTIHDKAASPNEKVYMEWNSIDQSLDFIFA